MNSLHSQCPCTSGKPFSHCCGPILDDHSSATTPEALMRSRFTAYRVKNAEHLLRSWDSSHRPETIEFGREKFVRLTVHESRVSPDHSGSAIVNYTALSISGNEIITLSESSRFTYRKNRWFYIDGDVRISRERLRAKSPCPCGSGKKSKRCCLV